VEADAVEDGHVSGVELRTQAEEMVEPEDASWPEHPVDVEERGLEHGVGHPVAERVHGMHDVQHAVGEGQPLHEADLKRHEPARRHKPVERRVEVQRRGHHRHVALPHPRRERRRPAADVEPDPHRPGRARPQHAVDAEPGPAVVSEPPPALLPLQVEAVLAEDGGPAPRAAAAHEAGVVLARVRVPAHGGVGRDGPQAPRERDRARVPRRGPRPAPAPRQRLAALEHELRHEGRVVGARVADVVRHVPSQLVLEVAAREAQPREQLVRAEVDVEAQRQPVGLDGQLQLPFGLLGPAVEVLRRGGVPVRRAQPGQHGLEEERRCVALHPKGRELRASAGQPGAGGVEVKQQRGRVPEVDAGGRRRQVHGERRAGEKVDGEEIGDDDEEEDLELGVPRPLPQRPVRVPARHDATHRHVHVLLLLRRMAPVLGRVHGPPPLRSATGDSCISERLRLISVSPFADQLDMPNGDSFHRTGRSDW
jgi:hypothetical protein